LIFIYLSGQIFDMNHLIVYTHLNPHSFTKAVVDEVEAVSRRKGHETKIIDLYSDQFNPVLEFPDIQYSFMDGEAPEDVRKYQEDISWANHITFVYPLWWEQMPAMLKGFIDRVFTNGYAYMYGENGPKGLLGEKTVQLIINTGNTSEYLSQSGMHSAIKAVVEVGIFNFCGMDAKTTFFGNVAMGSDEERKEYLSQIAKIYSL